MRLVSQLDADDPASLVAAARTALTVEDFAAASPMIERLSQLPDADARAARYAWEYARDNAPAIDSLTRARLAGGDQGAVPELLAAGRLAFDVLDFARADSLYGRALAVATGDLPQARRSRSAGHLGRAAVLQKRRQWDESLVELERALAEHATPEALETLANTLIRLGRTDEAVSAAEWGVHLNQIGRAHV